MMRTAYGVVAVLAVLTALSSIALAGVPCSGTSTVVATENSIPCTGAGAFCPKGDYNSITVTVTVLDCYGTALASKAVTVSPSGDATLKFQAADSAKALTTNGSGQVTATYTKLGGCGNAKFSALSQGVTLGPSNVIYCSNVDNNGTGKVDGTDLSIFAGHFGRTDRPCSDYNCSGKVDGTDFSLLAGHFGHQF
ncbi:MAG TPA: hypothetical protein VMU02_09065 [bacterium]|nr:hypothetical protein [bacterium]